MVVLRLGSPRAVIELSRLAIARSRPKRLRDRSERTVRVVEHRGQMQLEVHVTGEGQRDHARGSRVLVTAAGLLAGGR